MPEPQWRSHATVSQPHTGSIFLDKRAPTPRPIQMQPTTAIRTTNTRASPFWPKQSGWRGSIFWPRPQPETSIRQYHVGGSTVLGSAYVSTLSNPALSTEALKTVSMPVSSEYLFARCSAICSGACGLPRPRLPKFPGQPPRASHRVAGAWLVRWQRAGNCAAAWLVEISGRPGTPVGSSHPPRWQSPAPEAAGRRGRRCGQDRVDEE